MTQLVPYLDTTRYPQQPATSPTPGEINGVYVILPPDYQSILDKIAGWFANREEVEIVDHGVSDKVGLGYLMLEWQEQEVDKLFLDILSTEQAVADYTVYVRALEEE